MKRVMITLFMIIFMVSAAFSAGPFQPILTDVANIPELEDLNLIKSDELLTFGNSLTKLYFWDLNSRDSINKNFPIELNGKLLTQPITQRIFNDGLNYLTYCVEDIEGNIYFYCIDFQGSEYPGFPLLLQDKPVTTPVFSLIETNVNIMYSTESGQVIYFDLEHSLIPEEHHSIQTSGTNTEIYLKDISGDNQEELICKTYITENYYRIEYYEYLNEVWELSSNSLDFTGEIGSNLLFLDVTGDNIEEIIFGDSTGQLFIYSIFPNFTLIPNYPKVISNSSIEIINYLHGNTIAVTNSRKNTYKITLDSFTKEKILDRKYANQYSNYSLSAYSDTPSFTGIINYFTRFGSDVTIIKDTGEFEKWGYFNHSIYDPYTKPNIDITSESTVLCSDLTTDYIPIIASITAPNNYHEGVCSGEVYWAAYLIESPSKGLIRLPVSDGYIFNSNPNLACCSGCGFLDKEVVKIPLNLISSGNYTLLLIVQDGFGSFNYKLQELNLSFEDKPIAEIYFPDNFEVIDTEETGNQPYIIGTADFINSDFGGFPSNLDLIFHYYLAYSLFDTPDNKIDLPWGVKPVINDELGIFDLSTLNSDRYIIYLDVEITNRFNIIQYSASDSHPFILDKEHPTADISSISDDDVIHNTINIIGTADDPNFTNYQLFISETGADIWFPLTGLVPGTRNDSLLYIFNSLTFNDGYYDIKLSVRDIAGKVSIIIRRNIRIFNEPVNATLISNYNSFSPNGDECNDHIVFNSTSENMDNISSASLLIYNQIGTLVDSISVSDIYSSIIWDGKDESGTVLPEGLYCCKLLITSVAGKVYLTDEKIISISYTDEVITIFHEATLVDDNKYNIQIDRHPSETKILYLKTNQNYYQYPAFIGYPRYLNCVVNSNCSIWERNYVTGTETMLVDKQHWSWPGHYPSPYPYDKPLYMTKKPKYSPDGTKFMFIRGWKLREYNNGIVTNIQKQDGTKPTVYYYCWHPTDSNKFVYIEDYDYPQKLIIADNVIHTEVFQGRIDEVIWSENGNYIIFSGYEINHWFLKNIYSYNLTTGIITTLDSTSNNKKSLTLSPDSKKIAYVDNSLMFEEIRVLYLTEEGEIDINYLQNPKVIAPKIQSALSTDPNYEIFNWTNDNKWLMYGLVEVIPMLKAIDYGIHGPPGQSFFIPGKPEHWNISLQAVSEFGYNHHIIEDNIKTLAYKYDLSPNNIYYATKKIGGGRPEFDRNYNAYFISKYSLRESDLFKSDYLTVNTCIAVEGNVPGIVESVDEKVSVDVAESALNQSIDTLMITPIVSPAGSPPSDMTSIQPVIGEVYDVKLISNQPVFNDYVSLSFSYTDTQVTGIDESSLNVYTFDEDQQEWKLAQPDSSLVYRDYENNIITIYTHHLSLYVLSGKVYYEDNPNIISFGVINNPFSPNNDSIKDKVYVTAKVDQDSIIHFVIYNSGWNLIREYSANALENTIVNFNWDGKDVNGNIQNDGMYYAQVQAVNSGGLRSSVVFSKVYIDNTPPGIVISGVQDGGIYNIDVTPEITVLDVFIESLNITLNGSNFNWGAVISAEGNYSLVVSASDKAGNSSSASVQFLIDKTPSLSSIVYYPFSMEDGEITIIKQTEFEITSIDGGNPPSGMYKTEYKIIDDYYYDSGWLNYIEPFTLEDYQPGLWTIRYRGIDNAGNPEPNKDLTVKIGELFDEDESSINSGTVCLIWIDHEMLNENSPGIIKLKEILDEIVVYYKMVFEKDEFVNEFRTNLYNVYLIFGKDDSLGQLSSDELKAHIKLGRGIISSKFTGFTGEGNESEVFGVKFTGHYPGEANIITITNSLISTSDTITISTQLERLEMISPYSSQAAYYEFNNSSTPVIVLNSYGEGKAVYFGFDFIDSITNENMDVLGNILKNSIELVRKTNHL